MGDRWWRMSLSPSLNSKHPLFRILHHLHADLINARSSSCLCSNRLLSKHDFKSLCVRSSIHAT